LVRISSLAVPGCRCSSIFSDRLHPVISQRANVRPPTTVFAAWYPPSPDLADQYICPQATTRLRLKAGKRCCT
jgi:hypothetical protein